MKLISLLNTTAILSVIAVSFTPAHAAEDDRARAAIGSSSIRTVKEAAIAQLNRAIRLGQENRQLNDDLNNLHQQFDDLHQQLDQAHNQLQQAKPLPEHIEAIQRTDVDVLLQSIHDRDLNPYINGKKQSILNLLYGFFDVLGNNNDEQQIIAKDLPGAAINVVNGLDQAPVPEDQTLAALKAALGQLINQIDFDVVDAGAQANGVWGHQVVLPQIQPNRSLLPQIRTMSSGVDFGFQHVIDTWLNQVLDADDAVRQAIAQGGQQADAVIANIVEGGQGTLVNAQAFLQHHGFNGEELLPDLSLPSIIGTVNAIIENI